MSDSPASFISVVVPTCDRIDSLELCLRCLAPGAQSLDPALYEVIVTDDGRQPAREALASRFPFVRWVAGPRRGPAANRNAGAREARGTWLAFTDDDCEPRSGWLRGFASMLAATGARALEGRVIADPAPADYWEEAPTNASGGFFWTCNVVVETRVFRSIGGFDENYPTPAMEDIDLRMAIEKSGVQVAFCPEAIVNHPARRRSWKQRLRTARDFASQIYFGWKWQRRGLWASGLHMARAVTWHWLVVPLRKCQRGCWAAVPIYVAGMLALAAGLVSWYRRAVRLAPPSESR